MINLKLATAGLIALTGFLAPAVTSAALVTGDATITIDNAAVSGSNAGGWFFETFWGEADNALQINGSTTGGTALSASGTSSLRLPVNSNTTSQVLSTTGYGRLLQASTMDAGDTSIGQIGLSGAFRMRDPGLTSHLAPFDLAVSKTSGQWNITSHDTGFGTVGLFTLANVSESLNGNGELMLSGDLLWSTSFGYRNVLNADGAKVLGSFSLVPSAVPVPAAVWMFASGLVGLIGVARRKYPI
jgi:hypothetical protein